MRNRPRMQPIIPSSKRLTKNSLSGVLRSVIITLTFLVAYPIYISKLGVQTFGVWVMLNVIIMWSQLGTLGIPQTIMKFVAGSAAKGNRKELVQYVSSSLSIILISGIAIAILLFFIKNPLGNFLRVPATIKPQMPSFIFFAGLIVLVSFLAQSINSILSGVGRMDLANINEVIGNLLGTAVSIFLILRGFAIWGLLLGSMVNFSIVFTLASLLTISNLKFIPYSFKAVKKEKIKKAINFGGTLFAGSIFAMFLEPFNRFILGQYVSLAATTVYDVASKVLLAIRNIGDSALRPLMPQVSVYDNVRDNNKIISLNKIAINSILTFVVPLFLILLFSGNKLLPLWLGKVNLPNLNLNIRIMMLGCFLNLLVVPIYYTFMGIGKVKVCFKAHLIHALINCFLLLALINILPRTLAASLSVTVGLVFSALYLSLTFRYLFKIPNIARFFPKEIRLLPLSILCFLPLIFLGKNLSLLVAGIILIFTGYLFLATKLRLTDIKRLISALKSKKFSSLNS